MDFDFLPQLPSSRLDDRTFDDLVEECLLRIPRYCPEWTDHNLSDPGITLVELFAWLTDQMLMRFNQVPRKNYVAFLELLGIQLRSPTPAETRLTFYLSAPLEHDYVIPAGTEVATERTESQAAIAFTTNQDLRIGQPQIRHLLVAPGAEHTPQALQDHTGQWQRQPDAWVANHEFLVFAHQPQPGNSFYVVLEPEAALDGNVLALGITGVQGTPTGIDPHHPPRRWQAWDGDTWTDILLQETDDTTNGFSFNETLSADTEQCGDIRLHVPERWPVASFAAYRGRWLRCVVDQPADQQSGYLHSPRIKSLSLRAIGGTVAASQCVQVKNETLGISNGKPGQSFVVETAPILARAADEQLLVVSPGQPPEVWQEVDDFAGASPSDRAYTIDALAGTIQFGPLIRDPQVLKQRPARAAVLPEEPSALQTLNAQMMEHQYGAIPPRGAEILLSYRTGGGKQGNVQAHTLKFLKTTLPYVDRVTNHDPAVNGADAESLNQAALRVPQLLRSQERAVTPSDFEALTLAGSEGAVARAQCLPTTTAGMVDLCVVPQANTALIDQGLGIAPEHFTLNSALRTRVLAYLDDRRLLGIQVRLQEAHYTGVSVQAEITLEPAYRNPTAQAEILHTIQADLYRYLNPLTGGPDGTGWPFGRPVYPSDIMALLQQQLGIQYLGAILLFPIENVGTTWQRQTTPMPCIDPGPMGLLCSWAHPQERTGHIINIFESPAHQPRR